MDRKGWIVIITCILLMGVNFYYMQENQKLAEAQRAAEQAKKKAEAPKDAPAAPAAEASKPSQQAPATPSTPEQKHSITSSGGIANYDYVSIAKKLISRNKSVAAFSFIRLGVDNIPNTLNLIGPDGTVDYNRVTNFSASDYAGIFSYAQTFGRNEKFSLGGNIKVIHRSIGSFGKAWGFGADLGVRYKGDKYILGLSARDITTTFNAWSLNLTEEEKRVFQSTGNDIPISSTEITLPRLIFGAAYFVTKGDFNYLAEMDLNISTNGTESGVISGKNINLDPSLGIEVGYIQKVFLRVGLGNMQTVINQTNTAERDFEIQPNVGLGLKLGRLKVDYALANIGSVSGVLVSHIFSLTLDFAPRN